MAPRYGEFNFAKGGAVATGDGNTYETGTKRSAPTKDKLDTPSKHRTMETTPGKMEGGRKYAKGGHVNAKEGKAKINGKNDEDDDDYARGGAARGVPGSKRKGHPMPGKKPVMGKASKSMGTNGVADGVTVPPSGGLGALTAGSMGSGPGESAMPQGQVPMKKGGKASRC